MFLEIPEEIPVKLSRRIPENVLGRIQKQILKESPVEYLEVLLGHSGKTTTMKSKRNSWRNFCRNPRNVP